MAYIINSKGNKIKVNNFNNGLNNKYYAENIVLLDENAILVDKYIIEIYKKDMCNNNEESDFITEIILHSKPSNEEIIFHMVQNGINRYTGYAVVKKIKTLDFKYKKN